jgi:hypothetical protein
MKYAEPAKMWGGPIGPPTHLCNNKDLTEFVRSRTVGFINHVRW